MTTTPATGARSMRFSIDELLQGMFASIEQDRFSADPDQLATIFSDLAGRFDLFAPVGATATPGALEAALTKLESRNVIHRAEGQYVMSAEGRAQCVSCKRTLFNQQDRGQLEEAAKLFGTL